MPGRLGAFAAVLAGAVATVVLLFGPEGLILGSPFIVVLLLLLAWAIGRNMQPEARTRIRRFFDRAFLGFFAVYTAAAFVFLLAGLAPAVAHAIPSLHASLHRYAGAVERTGQIAARDNAFDVEQLTIPSGLAIVRFTNLDVGVDHNVSVYAGTAQERDLVFRGETIKGTDSIEYRFAAPPAGEYLLWCDVHPFMNGKIVVTNAPAIGSVPGPTGLRGLAGRVAAASHGSVIASDTTGQRLVPGAQVAANYVFSMIDLVLAILLIAMRPRDRTARLLAIGLVGTAAVFNAQAHVAFEVLPGSVFTSVHDVFHLGSGVAFMLAMLLFPDGRFVPRIVGSPARQTFSALARVGLVFLFVMFGFVFASGFHGSSPGGYVAFFGVLIPAAGVISQSVRLREARSEPERRRTRVLLWALAIPLGATIVAASLVGLVGALRGEALDAADFSRAAFLVFPALFTVIPLVLVVVLVRYRLWDVERVVSKALVYGVLAAFVSTVYVLVVAGIGAAVGNSGEQSLPLSIAATAVVAVAFDPLRRRLQKVANVLVYGHRASPADVVAGLARRMSDSLSVEETLPALAEAAGRAVGAERAAADVALPGGALRSAAWPLGTDDAPEEDAGAAAHTVPVLHHGRDIGAIRVSMPEGEAVDDERRALLDALARQAGPALHNVQLAAELEDRLDEISRQAAELRASRQRIVSGAGRRGPAAGARPARRRPATAGGDGDHGPARAAGGPGTIPNDRTSCSRASSPTATETLATIRDLAHGIYPPLLAQEGLRRRSSRRSGGRRSRERRSGRRRPVRARGGGGCLLTARSRRCRTRRSTRAPRDATVRLSNGDGRLTFTVTDDGRGFDPAVMTPGAGLQNMEDRVAALGGTLSVTSTPGPRNDGRGLGARPAHIPRTVPARDWRR